MRVALIGAGSMGQLHLKVMKMANVEIAGVCDIKPEILKKVRAEYRVPVYTNYKEMLENESPDGVIIATPPHLHREQALYALRNGFHVLLEKPMGANLYDARAIYRKAKGTNKLMVAFSLRFHGLFIKVKEYLDKELGDILFQWHVALGRTPRNEWIKDKGKSGGMINENAVHVIYYFLWYAGDIKKVYGRCWTLEEDATIEDNAVATFVHKNGAVSTLMQTWTAQHRWRKWGLQATNGTVTVDGYLGGDYRISKREMQILEEGNFSEPVEEMYLRQLKHFIECIENGTKPVVNEADGLKVHKAVSALYRASKNDRQITI
ncbi:Gfo/Idh/MocA family protein [Thermococcus barophilus]|nr:Gfo/Idh/MocA family oxidoreductase [Thermococcus barophilus]